MFNRKGAVSMAIVAAVTATAGSALAAGTATKAPVLTLEPTVLTMDDAATAPAADAGPTVSRPTSPSRPLMSGLDKLGAASVMDKYNLNIYGWIEGSYTYNHRHTEHGSSVTTDSDGVPPNKVGIAGQGPFNHEAGDNFMGNQLAIRFERQIQDSSKVDIGFMVEVMYGQDAAAIHSNGLEYGNTGPDARYSPAYQFDIPQAYVDISVGVKGLTFRVGKFVTLLGTEYIKPDDNALFSHSYLFYSIPFTQTGVYADYHINDQWEVKAGITRGWDQATEDSPSCALDGLYQIIYTPNSQLTVSLAGTVGPNNGIDTSHYRVAIDPTVTYHVTDNFWVGAEMLYVYDGGMNATGPDDTHHYGDIWGVDLYAGYKINDYLSVNGRAEKAHFDNGVAATTLGGVATVNVYSFTLGVTITPFANDTTGFGSALKIRPEIRYDYSEDHIFDLGGHNPNGYKDQFTMGCDIIYAF